MTTMAVFHPGNMGAAVGREALTNAHSVLWLPEGRSTRTAERARAAGLTPAPDLTHLFDRCDVVLSVCPPGPAADEIADLALEHHFKGLYIDANAISPRRMSRISSRLRAGGIDVVDASIIGSPPTHDSTITLYLSGERDDVASAADLFANTQCIPARLDRPVGAASALKAAYSSYQKTAYLLSGLSHALAVHHGIDEALLREAIRNTPGTPLAIPQRITTGAAKAWRWIDEFGEIADALTEADLPPEIARTVAVILAQWADRKDDFDITIPEALLRLKVNNPGQ
jgi:3-hydroxyisobutyrate dehydrogenase-like beta-hydroxyacid dehydrogenase